MVNNLLAIDNVIAQNVITISKPKIDNTVELTNVFSPNGIIISHKNGLKDPRKQFILRISSDMFYGQNGIKEISINFVPERCKNSNGFNGEEILLSSAIGLNIPQNQRNSNIKISNIAGLENKKEHFEPNIVGLENKKKNKKEYFELGLAPSMFYGKNSIKEIQLTYFPKKICEKVEVPKKIIHKKSTSISTSKSTNMYIYIIILLLSLIVGGSIYLVKNNIIKF